MKILAIRGCNLASLESNFEIDFMTDPLKSAGIFAITGQTGAGKSTILDALCLALFDNAPRLNKAESVNINDVEDKTITQKDSRNILRRGASEGYAEVDFKALNGDTYRSRWMVRRARGKADGALQPTTMRVENLTTSKEEQGTKSNLLTRITELIGLTFDQFTRAVLLAQGDFANFLKAKSNEKAELLEKLTGTEIYSKISERIYQKTQEAKSNFLFLEQRIKDVNLLSDEDLILVENEQKELNNRLLPLKNESSILEKKTNWFKEDQQLKVEINEVKQNLLIAQQTVNEAAGRFKYIEMIDQSGEIRDTYNDLTAQRNNIIKLRSDLEIREKELAQINEQYNKQTADLNAAKDALENINKEYETLKPSLEKAKEIDLLLKSQQQNINELQKELESFLKQKADSEQKTIALQEEQKKEQNKQVALNKWFADNNSYKNIVQKTDLITSLIDSISGIKQNSNTTALSLQSSKELLSSYNEQLKLAEGEAERLDQLLPTEVVNLRNKLTEGMPCPVCGSTHHPLNENIDQTQKINEAELQQAKEKNKKAIESAKANIEKIQKSITEFETYLLSFSEQLNTNRNALQSLLTAYPDWEKELELNTLKRELQTLATEWSENMLMLEKCVQTIENSKIKLEGEEKTLFTVKQTIAEKQIIFQKQKSIYNENIEQRKELIGDKNVTDIEQYFSTQKTQLTKQYEELRNRKEQSENNRAATNAQITQLTKEIETIKAAYDQRAKTIEEWLENNRYQISKELLKELVSKPREWIVQEKLYLDNIQKQVLVLDTTLKERDNRYQKHLLVDDRPADDELQETIIEQLIALQQTVEIITNRLTEINVSLLAHRKGKEQVKAFEKELHEKQETFDNWAKLNDLLGSANGNKFKTIAQGYTLDILLSYANKHLEELSKRYKLQKIADSLSLQVIDNDMFGEIRSVHSLSGGESFLISLALALGLSSLSSNRMNIESLFIDEGFGALDIDTLSIAMDALDSLQTTGRKIGVISHVEEMKERITTQIQVLKTANGRSTINIVG